MENNLVIQCVYCNEPWTAKMKVDEDMGGGCDTCGTSSSDITVEIYCENPKCKRLVYKKTGKSYDW